MDKLLNIWPPTLLVLICNKIKVHNVLNLKYIQKKTKMGNGTKKLKTNQVECLCFTATIRDN